VFTDDENVPDAESALKRSDMPPLPTPAAARLSTTSIVGSRADVLRGARKDHLASNEKMVRLAKAASDKVSVERDGDSISVTMLFD
jgi:hypothetical protein